MFSNTPNTGILQALQYEDQAAIESINKFELESIGIQERTTIFVDMASKLKIFDNLLALYSVIFPQYPLNQTLQQSLTAMKADFHPYGIAGLISDNWVSSDRSAETLRAKEEIIGAFNSIVRNWHSEEALTFTKADPETDRLRRLFGMLAQIREQTDLSDKWANLLQILAQLNGNVTLITSALNTIFPNLIEEEEILSQIKTDPVFFKEIALRITKQNPTPDWINHVQLTIMPFLKKCLSVEQ